MKSIALVIFIAMYVVMIVRQKWRVFAALGAALLYVILGIQPLTEVLGDINWNVLMMITGTMLMVDYFIDSGMPNRIAEILMDKSSNVMWVTIYMSLFSGIISAFIDNVATVLIVAPVGLAVCKKLKISPVAMIISIAVSSNLQGAATLVGDATSILLGDYARMDFLDFFFLKGKPGIFWAVELGALATIPIMMFLFRKNREPVTSDMHTEVKNFLPSIMLILMVGLLISASFFPDKPDVTNGVICLSLALLTAVIDRVRSGSAANLKHAVQSLDYETILLLTGLFIVIGGIEQVGIIADLSEIIRKLGGGSIFRMYTILVWGSVVISAFVDNIPYVATMLPVIRTMTAGMGVSPYLLYFGLLSGATLGGNLTPVGASANITGVGMLRREGYEVKFSDFMRIGVPFTLAAVTTAYIFLWIFWR